ncbi:MAG TPA: GrpB family protein [Clostridia bacterium]|nr:GrpB family protein [Clostridia bacterium]
MGNIIGLKKGIVKLHKHKKQWKKIASDTIVSLYKVFGDTAVDIQHVGSTSIVNIKAKPIIDIAVAVNNFDNVKLLIPSLEDIGVIYKPNVIIAGEMYFVIKGLENGIFTHHIHVVLSDSKEWINYINFRNYLNAKPAVAKQYEDLKINLMKRYKHNRLAYTEGKSELINRILKSAFSWSYLGKTVTVTVDRPMGSKHPKFNESVYPVNYGYIDGITAGDNELQDAYIVGVKEPLVSFTGIVTGVVYRKDDVEDKWVVAPVKSVFNQAEIAEAVYTFEKYFDTYVDSIYQKSCGVIVYRKVNGNIEYLLVKEHESSGWSFPKGHMEAFESETDTAVREVSEETGIAVIPDTRFRRSVTYNIQPVYTKEVVFNISKYTGEVNVNKSEIDEAGWFNISEAKKRLRYIELCSVLEDAEEYIGNLIEN